MGAISLRKPHEIDWPVWSHLLPRVCQQGSCHFNSLRTEDIELLFHSLVKNAFVSPCCFETGYIYVPHCQKTAHVKMVTLLPFFLLYMLKLCSLDPNAHV